MTSASHCTEVSLLNEDIVTQVGFSLMKACTRACPPALWNDRTCFSPPSYVRQDGSSSIELVSFATFNSGGISVGGVDSSQSTLWILANHLVGAAPIEFTYSFRLSQAAPYFFGAINPSVALKKTNQDAHSLAVTKSHNVLHSFGAGEKIVITAPTLVAMAGMEWGLTTILQGGEFSTAVNCYNDPMDIPSLNWGGHSPVIPSSETPLCLILVELLRESSVSTLIDVVKGTSSINTYIRFDARRGDSFFRLPSMANLILSLIQCIILLGMPTKVIVVIATTCFGSLSQIYKRAQMEFFFIGFRMPSLGLRLVSDSMALAALSPGQDSVDMAAIQKKLQEIFAQIVPHRNAQAVDDLGSLIFKKNQKIAGLPNEMKNSQDDSDGCKPCDLANLMCIGQRARARDVAAYFNPSRRRGCLEWSVLPNAHRKQLRRKAVPSEKPPLLMRLSSRLSAFQPIEMECKDESDEEKPPTEKEILQATKKEATLLLQELKDDVKFMNNLNLNKTKEKDQKREQERAKRRADIRQLLQALASARERLKARISSARFHHEHVLQACDRKKTLEQRLEDASTRRAKLLSDLRSFRNRVSSSRYQVPLPEEVASQYESRWMIELWWSLMNFEHNLHLGQAVQLHPMKEKHPHWDQKSTFGIVWLLVCN